MVYFTAQQSRYGTTDVPDARELAELQRDERLRAERARKIFALNGIALDPWTTAKARSARI